MKSIKGHIKRLKMIENDMKNDAKELNGKPFNGKTVGEQFGYQGAAISALAHTRIALLEDRL